MKEKTEHPKVFISYAWTSKEYVDKVMNLATRLQEDGIEVIIDKWSMKPGNDTVNFMEKCVKDSEITYVLMLLDKRYTEKADNRTGGVGIETQIISNEVYNDVEQEKFIPIVFEKDKEGRTHIPTYLKTRFYYDMTREDSNEEYIRLVKHIYGEETYYKPQLGKKPAWVSESINNPSGLKLEVLNEKNLINSYETLKEKIKKFELKEYDDEESEKIIKQYKDSLKYRNALIELFFKNYNDKDFIEDTCEFYKNIRNWNKENKGLLHEIWEAFIHETFIYLVAVLLKYRQYKTINTFLTKSYFQNTYYEEITQFHKYFYIESHNIISNAKCKIDNQRYYSGIATMWIENIYEPKIEKKMFVLADLLLYNLSIILLETDWYWFPQTYIYDGLYSEEDVLRQFSIRLKSKYEVDKIKELFGVSSEHETIEKFKKMEQIGKEIQKRVAYGGNQYAGLITDFVKVSEIATLN